MTHTTQAVVIDSFGPIAEADYRPVTLPGPGPGEMLIDVAFVPANFVDSLVFTGKYQFLPVRPFTPGKGPAGTVLAVGPGVTDFAVGDRVLSMAESGGYAGAAIVPVQGSYRLPEGVSCEDAAVLSLAFDTAWVSLFERGRLAPGETVLVLGATGAVGNAAIQLARAVATGCWRRSRPPRKRPRCAPPGPVASWTCRSPTCAKACASRCSPRRTDRGWMW